VTIAQVQLRPGVFGAHSSKTLAEQRAAQVLQPSTDSQHRDGVVDRSRPGDEQYGMRARVGPYGD
jgi:hypothetical protein